jgi:hypothetical protein
MEVIGQLQTPTALPLGKQPCLPIEQEAGLVLKPIWTSWKTEKSFDPTGLGHIPFSLVTVPIEPCAGNIYLMSVFL